MYKASVNQYNFDIEPADESNNIDFRQIPSGGFSMMLNGTEQIADLVRIDHEAKQVVIRVEGKKYHVLLKEPVDLLLDKLGIQHNTHKKVNHLKAPMPGLVAKIVVKKGDHVKAGDPLLILEAMKMENVFKALTDVTIREIQIEEKQTVEKGQILILFE